MVRRCLLALLLTAGCATPTKTESSAITTRDSAGIVIVEYPQVVISGIPVWIPGPVSTALGGPEADAASDMTGIQLAHLEDSSFVVGSATSMHLRRFSFEGTLIGSGAGNGEGPGELLSIDALFATHTGVSVLDYSRSLLVHYTDSLRFRGQVNLRDLPGGRRSGVLSTDENGTLHTLDGPGARRRPGPSGVILRDSLIVARIAPNGGSADTLFSVAGGEFYFLEGGGTRSRRFGVGALLEKTPTGFLSGDGARWEVVVRDSSGTTRRFLRLALARRPVSEAMRTERLRLDHRSIDELPPGRFKEIRRMAEIDFATPRFPDSLPAFDKSRLGRDGTLWLRQGMAPTDSIQRWLVVFGDSILGRFELPSPQVLLDARRDRVLLHRTDSVGLGYVELRTVVPRP